MGDRRSTGTERDPRGPPDSAAPGPDLGLRLAAAVLDAIPDQACLLDDAGIIRFANAAWKSFCTANGGRPEATSEGSDYLAACRMVGDDGSPEGSSFANRLAEVLSARRQGFVHEYPCHSPSERRWYAVHVDRIAPLPSGLVLVRHVSTTERRMAEALSRERDAGRALEAAIEALPIGVAIVEAGPGGRPRIALANPAFDRIVGSAARGDVDGATLPYAVFRPGREDAVPPGEWTGPSALRSGRAVHHAERHVLRPDGTWRVVAASAAPIPSSDPEAPPRAMTVVLDTTDQFESQEALRSSARFLRQIPDAALDGFLLVDLEGRILDVNPAYCEMLGYDRAELLRMSIPDVEANESPEETAAHLRELRERGGGRFETRHRRKDGRTVDLELSASFLGGSGEVVAAFARDVTSRKQAEVALAQAKDAAERASRAKSEFLASMSHEIRTPLNGVIGMQQLLLQTPLSPEQREYVATASDSAQSLLHLVSHVLDLSRIEARQLALEPQAFSLRSVVDRVARPAAAAAKAKGIAFSAEVAPETPDRLVGDPWRLGQIVGNLLANAVKFTVRGEVALRVRGTVDGAGQADLSFSVQDTGIGIDAEAVGRLFAPFTQVDGSISRRFGGSGLGLYISRQLAGMMGGTVGVESVEGHGSTFRLDVRLPEAGSVAVATATPPASPSAADLGAPRRPLRILLAEDHPVNQLLATRLLEQAGHVVTVAVDGRRTLALLEKEPFDLVLMDVQMPEMDGLETLRRLRFRERATGAHVHAIAVTAQAMQGDREACIEAGADDYLSKPYTRAGLEAAVARAVVPLERTAPLPTPPDLRARFETCRACPALDLDDCERRLSQPPVDLGRAREACGGDEALRQEATAEQLRSLRTDREALRAAFSTGDWDRLARLAHRLRTSLAAVGASMAAEAARDLEAAARRADPLAGRACVRLLCELDRATPALAESLESPA